MPKDELTTTTKNFYDCFALPDGVLDEVRRQILDTITNSLSNGRKKIFQKYKNRDLSNVKTKEFEELLLFITPIYNTRIERHLNPIDIYEIFPLEENFTPEKRKEYVNALLTTLDSHQQKIFKQYLSGDPSLQQIDFVIAERIYRCLLKIYKKNISRYLKPCELYCLMPFMEDITMRKQKEITRIILSSLDDGSDLEIERYLKGKMLFTDVESKRVEDKINSLKKQYLEYVTEITKEITTFQNIIYREYYYKVENPMSFDKMYYLAGALKIIRENCLTLMYNREGLYMRFMQKYVLSIYEENTSASLDSLIVMYINLAYNEIVKHKSAGKASCWRWT